jgi:hypothetical protein
MSSPTKSATSSSGLGSRPGYRAIFTIKDDEVFVLALRAAEQDRLTPDDVAFDVDP